MDIPRELVYLDKERLSMFKINDKGSINQILYDQWLLKRTELIPEKGSLETIQLKAFNDAYYICTMALMHQVNIEFILYSLKRVDIPSVVLPMVHYYLSNVLNAKTDVSRYITLIETLSKKESWEYNLQTLPKLKSNKKINASLFDARSITPQLLSSINWWKVTGKYNIKDVKKIIQYFARNIDEQKMMAESIKLSAEEFEWEYNNNLQTYDSIDEDGKVIFIEDKPLDLSAVHHICDEMISGKTCVLIKQSSLSLDNKTPVMINLKQFLLEDWFDDNSSNREKFTQEWRTKLIDDLLETEWGNIIINDWGNKSNMIKCGLVGALKEIGVLKIKSKKQLAPLLNIDGVNNESVADYMGRQKLRPYYSWLRNYVAEGIVE